jgi:hypothetical protein
MHRYWITFEFGPSDLVPAGAGMGVGVTAVSLDDALVMVEGLFEGALPPVREVLTDVDVSLLDAGHVLPNIGNVLRRGVWYPRLTSD